MRIACLIIVLCSYYYLIVNVQAIKRPDSFAKLSTSWVNSESAPNTIKSGITKKQMRPILVAGSTLSNGGPTFACGFFCEGNCATDYLFAVFLAYVLTMQNGGNITMAVGRAVWSANADNLVNLDARVDFTSNGDLILSNFDGSVVWSTTTSGFSVSELSLSENGNLMLSDVNKLVIWQSFDHPSDALVMGQKLVSGNKLMSNRSEEGLRYSLRVTDNAFHAYINSNPPQAYFRYYYTGEPIKGPAFVEFINGSLTFGGVETVFNIPRAFSSKQFMKLGSDGHLRVIECDNNEWKEVSDLISVGECQYPMACGRNAVCSGGQCFCPTTNDGIDYFRPVDDRKPNLGCIEITPLSCNFSQNHVLVQLEEVTYFAFDPDIKNTTVDNCKNACLRNCSCKAAIYNASDGDCYLPSEIFSLISTENANPLVFIKIQNMGSPRLSPFGAWIMKNTLWCLKRFGITIGSSMLSVLIIAFVLSKLRKRRDGFEIEEDYFDSFSGITARFSYNDLKTATRNFNKKIGEGGYGSVFEGTLENGIKVAVKQLDSLINVKKSFVAEIETIGSIHHYNLVRLIGFHAGKSQLFLVYEFMSNGSLDQWIYHEDREHTLEWKWRKKIILDIAKGLAYLHEDCRHKIIHLDIKPQNILLDENFSAKVADFGLSKLIDKKQSQVMTTMRGTPGYLAPEWLSAVITEKVDVYSFGMVLLETLSGRKNFDQSQPNEQVHLLRFFRICAQEGRLMELVDKHSEDMQKNGAEVMDMMKVGSWCLHNDYERRPSMSRAVLEVVQMDQKNRAPK